MSCSPARRRRRLAERQEKRNRHRRQWAGVAAWRARIEMADCIIPAARDRFRQRLEDDLLGVKP